MVPEIIVPMAQLPALPNGKVNRKGLPPPDFTHVARRKYVGPHNLNEEHIQEIWHEVRFVQPDPVCEKYAHLDPERLFSQLTMNQTWGQNQHQGLGRGRGHVVQPNCNARQSTSRNLYIQSNRHSSPGLSLFLVMTPDLIVNGK